MQDDPVVIASYARTPMGGFQGALSGLKATELGAAAVRAAVERAGVSVDAVDRIYMGCVLPAGLGQAPARPKPPPSTKCADRGCRPRSWRMKRLALARSMS